jgi:hypothetical protein
MSALITIFSTPKPFTNPHIAIIQSNAIKSWMHLGREAEALLIGEEEGAAAAAKKEGIRLVRDVTRNPQGTPLVNSIFQKARENTTTPLLAYVNADIILTPDFITIAKMIQGQAQRFLAVGRRWDLNIKQLLEFPANWVQQLETLVKDRGTRHPAGGSDYFIFPRDCFNSIPDLAIGRAGWDNWMIYEARRNGWPVVETTPTYMVIHQQHDYSHLPGGKPHYRHPESDENVRLAGGRHVIYTLGDANYQLKDGRLVKIPLTWKKFWREIENFPATGLKSSFLARFSYILFHPVKSYWRFRVWLSRTRKENLR